MCKKFNNKAIREKNLEVWIVCLHCVFYIFDNGADHSKIRGRSNSTILLGVT